MSFRKFSLLAHLSRIEPPQQETRKEWTKDKNFLEKTVGTEKSSRFNIAWRKRTRRTKPLSLSFDIAMEVAKFIDIPDIFSLSKVSRLFNSVVNSRALWDGFMKEYSAKCLPLVADELSTPSELSVHDLKKAVIRTRYLVINWESKHPTHISPTSTVSLERTLVKNIQSRGPYLVSHNCMIVSIGSGSWACFRLDTGVCVSTCKPPRSLSAHPFIFPHSKSSSVYTVTTEHFGTSSKLSIRRLQLSSATDNSGDAQSEPVQEMTLPPMWIALRMSADIDRRRICALCLHPGTTSTTLKIFVVLDWIDNSCALLDTGLTYITNCTGVGAQFTRDGKGLAIFSHSQEFHWQCYEIKELQKLMFSADTCFDAPIHSLLSTHSRLHRFTPDVYAGGFSLLHIWNPLAVQSWRDCAALPPLSSFVYLLTTDNYGDDFMNFRTVQCRIVQYYATDDGPLHNNFSMDLQNCRTFVLADSAFPMMAVSFNHICWLSEKVNLLDGNWTFRRELLMASFPPPHEPRWNVRDHVRRMEIPDATLENAARIFLVPSEASVMVVTTGGKLHTFRYA